MRKWDMMNPEAGIEGTLYLSLWFHVGRFCVLQVYTEGGKKRVGGFLCFWNKSRVLSGIWVLVVR